MKYILGILQFILIVYICFAEFHKRSLSIFLWASLFILFGLVHLFTCFMPNNSYPDAILNTASLYVILFCFVYMLVRKVLTKNHQRALISVKSDFEYNDSFLNEKKANKFLYILVFVITIIVIYQLYYLITYAGGLFNTSWGTMRHSINSEYFSFSQSFTTLYFTCSGCLLLSLINKKKFLSVYIVILMLLEEIVSRNRIEILPLICCFLIYYMLKIDKLKIKQIIVVCIVAMVTVYSVYALRTFRHYGSLSTFINNFDVVDFTSKTNSYFINDDGELGLKKYFYYFILNNNDFPEFGHANTYKRILLVWLPTRWSFGLKPSDFALSMGSAVDSSIVGYSVHPTLFGDCYANLNFIGFLVLGIFWAIYVTILDNLVIKQKKYYMKFSMYSLIAISYVIIARGSVYNGFVWMFFGLIILFLIKFLLHIKIATK